LTRLGFNRTEAAIYLVLLELGQAQAGLISKRSQVNRTTTYDAIERLLDKGLVTYTVQANKKIFRPAVPSKILENLREQEKLTRELLPKLDSLFKDSKEKEESEIYKGRRGIKSIMQDILRCKEYVAFGSSGRFLEIMKHDFLAFQVRKRELKIRSRIILDESSRGSESVEKGYASFRFIPEAYSAPTTTFVYGGRTAIIVWGETPIATVIRSEEVAESYRNYFKLLWKIAEP